MTEEREKTIVAVGDAGARWWVLPMLLTVAPLWLLIPTLAEERAWRAEEAGRGRLAESAPTVARIRAAASLKFWAAQTGRRLRVLVDRRLAPSVPARSRIGAGGHGETGPAWPRDRGERSYRARSHSGAVARRPAPPDLSGRLAAALAAVGPRYRLAGAPPVRVWAFALPATGGDPGRVETISGPGLETAYRRFMGQMFGAMAATLRESTPVPQRVLAAAQEIFGPGISRDALSASGKGVAHHVIFQGRFCLLVWDVWMGRRLDDRGAVRSDGPGRLTGAVPIGGFLMLMDLPPADNHLGMKLCLRHWSRLAPGRAHWPGFFRFPGPPLPESPESLLHPAIATPEMQPALQRLVAEVSLQPAPERLSEVERRRWVATAAQSPVVGDGPVALRETGVSRRHRGGNGAQSPVVGDGWPAVFGTRSFPVHLLERCVPVGGAQGRVVNLGPDQHYFAVLIMPGTMGEIAGPERIWWLLLAAWAGGWAGWLAIGRVSGWRPQPGVAMQLAGWFLGLAALAGAVVFASHRQLMRDLEIRLLDQTRRGMAGVARSLEGEAERHTWRQGMICNRILTDPTLQDALRRDRLSRARSSALLAEAFARLERHGMQPQILAAVGSDGYVLAQFSPSIAPEDQARLTNVIRGYGEPFVTRQEGWQIAQPSGFNVGILFSDDRLADLRNPGATNYAVLGGRQISRLHQFVEHGGRTLLYLVAFWDRGRDFQEHLRRRLRHRHGRSGHEVAVFLREGADLRLIAAAGRVTTLRPAVFEMPEKSRFIVEDGGRFLRYYHPSQNLAGHLFALRVPLAPVMARLAVEERSFRTIVVTGLLMIVLAGIILNSWLVEPIRAMTVALERVDRADFSVRVGLTREDELGRASATLDRMVERLQERDRMSRFVSAGVLEVIKADGAASVGRARRGQVVMLFCDIREFTTLSERHPPEAIFATLNRHFEAMTPLIQAEGGTIERFIGDAIQAVFLDDDGVGETVPSPVTPPGEIGASHDQVDPSMSRPPAAAAAVSTDSAVERALRAAVAMTRRQCELQRSREAAGVFPYRMGIGLAIGEGITGVVGDERIRQDFSVIGPPVSLAASMEALTKQLPPGSIVVSDEVRLRAGPKWRFAPVPGHPGAWVVNGAEAGSEREPDRFPSGADQTAPVPDDRCRERSPDAVGDSRAIGIVAATSVRSGLRRVAWAGIAFWGLAWGLMGMSNAGWERDLRARQRRQAEAELRQDLLEVQKSASERVQVPLFLREVIHSAMSGWERGGAPMTDRLSVARRAGGEPGLASSPVRGGQSASAGSRVAVAGRVGRALERLRRQWPSLTWAVVRAGGPLPSQPFDEGRLCQEVWWRREAMGLPVAGNAESRRFLELARTQGWRPVRSIDDATYEAAIVASSAAPVPLSPWQLVFMQWIHERYRLGSFHAQGGWEFDRLFVGTLGEKPVRRQHMVVESCGALRRYRLNDREMLVFWEPIPEGAAGLDPVADLRYDAAPAPASGLQAGVFVFIRPDEVGLESGLRAMIRRLGRNGTFVALTAPGSGAALMHPLLRSGLGRRLGVAGAVAHDGREPPAIVQMAERNGVAAPRMKGWVTGTGWLEAGIRRFEVTAFRRVAVVASSSPALRVAGVARWLWLLVGALVVRWWLLGAGAVPFSLRSKLVAAFLAMMVPTLVVSSGVLGRRAISQAEGAETREAAVLEHELEQAEEASEALLGWNSRIMCGVVRQPELLAAFAAGPSGEAGDVAVEMNGSATIALHEELLRYGVTMMGCGTGGPGAAVRTLNPWADQGDREEPGQLFVQMLKRSLRLANPALRGEPAVPGRGVPVARSDLLAEEMLSALHLMSSGELLADFLGAPRTACRMELGPNSVQAFRVFLPLDGPVRLVLWALWDYRTMIVPVVADWRRQAERGVPRDHRVVAQVAPNVTFRAPFIAFWPADDRMRIGGTRDFSSVAPPAIGRLISTAVHSGETVCRVLGEGDVAALMVARRSIAAGRFLVTIASPLGRVIAGLERAAGWRQGFLLLVLAGACLLARGVAARFLEPLEAFSRAAAAVTAGRFRVELIIDRTDEFGALARAFNRMCRGIEEGRLLRRFVSDSVAQVARDVGGAAEARRGRRQEVVVLFAGVTGFLEQLRHRPTDRLIDAINTYLSSIAGRVTEQRGEIDKFIGEKVLAVFAVDRYGDPATAAAAAVTAGREIVREVGRGDPFLRAQLGVGIVSGRVLAGILGTPAVRLEYTVLGDPVNLASRLCDLAIASEGPTVLLDAATTRQVVAHGFPCAPLGTAAIKGKTHEVEVYRLLTDDHPVRSG